MSNRLATALLAAVAAIAFAVGFWLPAEVEATCFCVGPVRQTAVVTGTGATCNGAHADAQDDALQLAFAFCDPRGVCEEDFIITSACTFNGSQWSLSGFLKFKCASVECEN
jgi:hypothetical protein